MKNNNQENIKPRILTGKLTVPSQTPDATYRSRIIDEIKASNKRVSVIAAPAGFGKSMLMSQLYQSVIDDNFPAGWLTLDKKDNDVGRFFMYLSEVINRISPDNKPEINSFSTGPGEIFSVANEVNNLISIIEENPTPSYIFIDELENIENPDVLEIIQEVINYLPADIKIIIGSRNINTVSLYPLELSGQLLKVDASNLRFDIGEVKHLFNKQEGYKLSEKDISLIISRTQGWAAGIRLVLLTLNDQEDPSSWLESLSGNSESIAGYLAENVLSKLSDAARSFLIKTSILDQLNSEICDYILDSDDSNSFISSCIESNLFITRTSQPLEPGLVSYRFHSLFKDFLFQELKASNSEIISMLHLKASQWFYDRRHYRLAVDHALLSGDFNLSARMMNESIMGLIEVSQIKTVAEWLDALPDNISSQFINIQRAKAYAMISLHRYREAEEALQNYRELAEKEGLDVSLEVLVQLALLHEFTDNHHVTSEDLKHFPVEMEGNDPLLVSIAHNIVAYHQMANSQFTESLASLAKAKKIYEESNQQSWSATYTYCFEGFIEFLHGNLSAAKSLFEAGKDRSRGASKSIASAFISRSIYESDDIVGASSLLQEHLKPLRDTADLDTIIMSYRLAARCAYMDRNLHQAENLLSELGDIGDRRGANRAKASAWLEKCRLSLLKGELESARRYLELASNKANWEQHKGFNLFANEIEDVQTAIIRLTLISGKPDKVIPQLLEMIEEASTNRRLYRRAHLQNFLAQAYFISDQMSEALEVARSNMRFCEAHKLVRVLADEPWYLSDLIKRFESNLTQIKPDYIATLLKAIEKTNTLEVDKIKLQHSANPLTPRESGILKLVSDGRANKEIARLLDISANTVETHLKRINQKLNTTNRTQAVAEARNIGAIG